MKSKIVISVLFIAIDGTTPSLAEEPLHALANELFGALPRVMPGSENDTEERIALGRALYFEPRLSANNVQSCNTCHNLLTGGTEPRSTSKGALGNLGRRNSPTTWNAGFQFSQFWDGRSADLFNQAGSPILNPNEMALPSKQKAVDKLMASGYLPRFISAYPEDSKPLNFDNILESLAAFQRTLITIDRFDKYLSGDISAISAQEKNGLLTFITKGCNACHNGPLLGGELFVKMGLVNPYPNTSDKGRAEITGSSADNFIFKVPTLRNVSRTAPYFHDGAVERLDQAIEDTAWHQLGIRLTKSEVEDIEAFFKTLDNTKVL
ncbi:cytochrome-c peroxidase [Veronia pacifica]